ncbi:hypothetical protein [Acinetobacter populi]|uniref:Antirepressor protein ant N-terminal domain-containing protein n=1 Tax=Acinetobacter populi TaxID=1582270 RepID=A0A1Z9Z2U1_9GAMM|nr:hypothetical protein [Acinetobacter populi]OUY08737.1 hypothetical protein CAP51_03740 [Acinetobacter populi]
MTTQTTAKITDIIYFHGCTLPIITWNNINYVPAKYLTDLAGVDWRTAKRSLLDEENILLYAIKQFKSPVIAAQGGSPTTPDDVIHIQFDRAYFYLARINTKIMKAMGNVTAAEQLLQLQIEWAKVLHDYETDGIAIKGKSTHNELMQIMKMRQMAIGQEKQVFSKMLQSKLAELGYQPDGEQGDLFK